MRPVSAASARKIYNHHIVYGVGFDNWSWLVERQGVESSVSATESSKNQPKNLGFTFGDSARNVLLLLNHFSGVTVHILHTENEYVARLESI